MADQNLDFKIRLSAEDRAKATLKAAAAAIKEVEAAQKSANEASKAWQTLGARSGSAIRADMEQVKAALATLKNTGQPFEDLGRATQAAGQRIKELQRELAGVEKPITGIERLFSKVTQAFLALQVVLKGAEIATAADNFEKLRITLAQSEGSLQGAQRALSELYRIAQSASVPIEAMTVSYARYTRSVAAMGGSQQEALNFTEALAKALRLSNATAEETGAVMRQLSQAFNKGKLNGDEFVSVAENGGRVLDYLARQIGKSRGELQEMSKAGELTDAVLLKLGDALEKIRKDYDVLPKSLSDAWVNFRNTLIVTLGNSQAFQAAMSGLANVVLLVSRHIEVLLVALGALGAAWIAAHVSLDLLMVKMGMLAGSFVVATGSVEAFTAALWAMMRNPYALAIGAIVAMIAYDWVGAWDKGKAAQTSALDNLKNQLNQAERQIAALDGQISRSKEKIAGLYDDLAKQFEQFGKLQDDSKDIDLTTLKRRYDQELALLAANIDDKDRLRLAQTALILREIDQELAAERKARDAKVALIGEEYNLRMDLAAKTSAGAGDRAEREAQAVAQVTEQLKRLWSEQASAYTSHLQQLEGQLKQHQQRIKQMQKDAAGFVEKLQEEIGRAELENYDDYTKAAYEKQLEEKKLAQLRQQIREGDLDAAAQYLDRLKQLRAQDKQLYTQSGEQEHYLSNLKQLLDEVKTAQADKLQREEASVLAIQKQTAAMEKQLAAWNAMRQDINAQLEHGASLRIGFDEKGIMAELDTLIAAINQREGAKLQVKLLSDQIDAQALIKGAKGGGPPVKVPVQLDINPAMLGEEVDQALAQVPTPQVPVTAQVQDPAAAAQAIRQDLARTPAQVPVGADTKPIEAELANLDRLTQQREVLVQLRANTQQALDDLAAFQAMVASTQSTHTIVTNASQALSEILSLNGVNTSSTHTIYVRRVESNAQGGHVGLAAGGFPRRQGYILGPGTETSDSIPALLSRGEYVLRAAAVRKWGLGFLEALNRGFLPALPRLALGGAVAGPSRAADLPEMAINLSIQGGEPLRVLSSRETARNLAQALRDLQRGR